jgi:hypothetical protein
MYTLATVLPIPIFHKTDINEIGIFFKDSAYRISGTYTE